MSRVHVSCMPGQSSYQIDLGAIGSPRRAFGGLRRFARFSAPWQVQAVLRGLRYLDRKRANLATMAAYLAAGETWADRKVRS